MPLSFRCDRKDQRKDSHLQRVFRAYCAQFTVFGVREGYGLVLKLQTVDFVSALRVFYRIWPSLTERLVPYGIDFLTAEVKKGILNLSFL